MYFDILKRKRDTLRIEQPGGFHLSRKFKLKIENFKAKTVW